MIKKYLLTVWISFLFFSSSSSRASFSKQGSSCGAITKCPRLPHFGTDNPWQVKRLKTGWQITDEPKSKTKSTLSFIVSCLTVLTAMISKPPMFLMVTVGADGFLDYKIQFHENWNKTYQIITTLIPQCGKNEKSTHAWKIFRENCTIF